MREGNTLLFHAEIVYNESNFRVSSVSWNNPGPYRWRLNVVSPNRPDIETIIEVGASGQATVAQGYFVDGPLGAGYQLWPV